MKNSGFYILLGVMLVSSWAHAKGMYYDTKSVLKDFFKDSERVTYQELHTTDISEKFVQRLGYTPAKSKYIIFTAYTQNHLDGYAVIDEELGQHLPITLACQISPDGVVVRTEVMVYREGYGGEIREKRFQEQFTGTDANHLPQFGRNVVAVTGATISSRSMVTAIQRAVILVDLLRK